MITRDTSPFKKSLLAELERLESELSSVGRRSVSNPSDWETVPVDMDVIGADKNEVADKFEEMIDNNAIMNELEVQYNEVKAALQRIEEGTYGICEKGGEPIAEKRLEAFPSARTCVEHKDDENI